MIANSFCCYRKGAQKAWYEKYTNYIKLGNKTGLVRRAMGKGTAYGDGRCKSKLLSKSGAVCCCINFLQLLKSGLSIFSPPKIQCKRMCIKTPGTDFPKNCASKILQEQKADKMKLGSRIIVKWFRNNFRAISHHRPYVKLTTWNLIVLFHCLVFLCERWTYNN